MQFILLLIQFLIAVFIIRFHTSLYRLGFNPVLVKINEYTDPLVAPLRKIPLFDPRKRMQYQSNRLLRKILNYDLPALLAGFIISLCLGFLLWGSFSAALFIFLSTWVNVIYYGIFVTVIGSWLSAEPQQPVMQIALSCSEWLLAPLRRIIPAVGGVLDFSPVVALIILSLFSQAIAKFL